MSDAFTLEDYEHIDVLSKNEPVLGKDCVIKAVFPPDPLEGITYWEIEYDKRVVDEDPERECIIPYVMLVSGRGLQVVMKKKRIEVVDDERKGPRKKVVSLTDRKAPEGDTGS